VAQTSLKTEGSGAAEVEKRGAATCNQPLSVHADIIQPGDGKQSPDKREGLYWWLDFVSPGRGGHYEFGERGAVDNSSGLKTENSKSTTIVRGAQVLTAGLEWESRLFSVKLVDSIWEGGSFQLEGMDYPQNLYSFFTSPSIEASLRPVRKLRLDLDVDYLFAFDLKDLRYKSHSLLAGVHVAFEPWQRFIGGTPLFDVAVGAKVGLAWGSVDPPGDDTPESSYSSYGFGYGLRLGMTLPLGEELGLFTALGYYIEAAHTADLFAEGGMLDYGNLEWTLALRWFPQGH